MLRQQAIDLALYNQWMNRRLYAVCAELDDADRKADWGRVLHIGSRHLNHLLLADKVWRRDLCGLPSGSGVAQRF